MGSWTSEAKLDPIKFDGDVIDVRVRRLTTEDIQKLSSFMKPFQGSDGSNKIKLSFSDQLEVASIATDLLPRYILSIDGMKTGDGSVVTAERYVSEMVGQFYFLEFNGLILANLVSVSTVQEDEEKNLETPSNDT